MSNLVFPDTLMGIDINIKRTEVYSTLIQSSPSGKEVRTSFQATPRFEYELTFNFLRQLGFSANTYLDEVLTLTNFFQAHFGSWDSFLFNDPVDGVQRRVRFTEDRLSFERMFNLCWSGGTVKLLSVK